MGEWREYYVSGGVEKEDGKVHMLPFGGTGLGLVMQALHFPNTVPPILKGG